MNYLKYIIFIVFLISSDLSYCQNLLIPKEALEPEDSVLINDKVLMGSYISKNGFKTQLIYDFTILNDTIGKDSTLYTKNVFDEKGNIIKRFSDCKKYDSSKTTSESNCSKVEIYDYYLPDSIVTTIKNNNDSLISKYTYYYDVKKNRFHKSKGYLFKEKLEYIYKKTYSKNQVRSYFRKKGGIFKLVNIKSKINKNLYEEISYSYKGEYLRTLRFYKDYKTQDSLTILHKGKYILLWKCEYNNFGIPYKNVFVDNENILDNPVYCTNIREFSSNGLLLNYRRYQNNKLVIYRIFKYE